MDLELAPLAIVTEQMNALAENTIALAPNVIAALVILILTWIAAALGGRILSRVLRRSNMRSSLVTALTKLLRIGIWVFGLLIAATVIFPNLTPAKLIAGLGIGSIAIGLAFKDTFENFLAGFLILMRKPMRIGDDIECDGIDARVEDISIRDSYLRKRSGELVIVPNSHLFKNPVEVVTDRPLRRISVEVGVGYGDDLDSARQVIRKAVEGLDSRAREKDVDVFATTFNSSSMDFLVRWWTKSRPAEAHASRDEAVSAIKRALDEAGIEIPFPQRTLTFAEPVPLPEGSGR